MILKMYLVNLALKIIKEIKGSRQWNWYQKAAMVY